ncbi:hypothetical protein C1I98_26330 [Spongiactinospora gelatinilytica]|uniref:Uncharacterized protein n=1 Tax=Spongiactinospora gelatinilytica TaxID=2666298 RepID=A0A2W2GHM9_9ACTN|nr:hypothetical protein C1I98_26330 [Spongiactinospora gelatinilytica]
MMSQASEARMASSVACWIGLVVTFAPKSVHCLAISSIADVTRGPLVPEKGTVMVSGLPSFV